MKTLGRIGLLATLALSMVLGVVAGDVWAAAATADRNTQLKTDVAMKSYLVKGATKIYKGTMVCIQTTGYALPCADTAAYLVVGIADGQADNSAGADGAIYVKVRAYVVALLNASSITQAMVGTKMYVVDDNTMDDAAGTNGITAGVLVEYVSATSGWVFFEPQINPNQQAKAVLGGSATLDFASAAATVCSADLTITVAGAASGNPVSVSPPNASVNAGSSFTAWVSAANTVTVRHCNTSAGANDPASGTYKVLVSQF